MVDVVRLEIPGGRTRHRRRHGGSAEVRAFPGARQFRVVDNVAAHIAMLDRVAAEEFLVFHMDVEDRRLTALGVSDPEIERFIFEATRAIWNRMRWLQTGAA